MLEHITMDSGGKERAAVSRRAFLLRDIKNGSLWRTDLPGWPKILDSWKLNRFSSALSRKTQCHKLCFETVTMPRVSTHLRPGGTCLGMPEAPPAARTKNPAGSTHLKTVAIERINWQQWLGVKVKNPARKQQHQLLGSGIEGKRRSMAAVQIDEMLDAAQYVTGHQGVCP